MEPEKIKLVQDSFAQVRPIADDAAALFYKRLFEIDPELKALFSGDMKEQGQKLMKMLGMATNQLNDLDNLLPIVQSLGKRHVDYGVKEEDYDKVGAALLWTLEQGLGDGFTPQCRKAWTETYNLLATTMIDAARH